MPVSIVEEWMICVHGSGGMQESHQQMGQMTCAQNFSPFPNCLPF